MRKNRIREKYFRQVVIALNSTRMRTKKEKKCEIFRALPVLIGVFFPIVVIPLCAGLRKLPLGFTIVSVIELICLTAGILLAKNNVNSFYSVVNAHEKVTVIPLPNHCQIADCCNVFSLLGLPEDDVLDFIYNWAYGVGLLRSDALNLYMLDDNDAKQFFGVSGRITVWGCRTDELNVSDITLAEMNRLDFTLSQANSSFVNGRTPAEQYFVPEEEITASKTKFDVKKTGCLLFSHRNIDFDNSSL